MHNFFDIMIAIIIIMACSVKWLKCVDLLPVSDQTELWKLQYKCHDCIMTHCQLWIFVLCTTWIVTIIGEVCGALADYEMILLPACVARPWIALMLQLGRLHVECLFMSIYHSREYLWLCNNMKEVHNVWHTNGVYYDVYGHTNPLKYY